MIKFTPIYKGIYNMTPSEYKNKKKRSKRSEIIESVILSIILLFSYCLVLYLKLR